LSLQSRYKTVEQPLKQTDELRLGERDLPFLAPTLAAYPQHRTECLAFRAKKCLVVEKLKLMGFTK